MKEQKNSAEYQIAIYSGDAVFARMLELEFLMRGKRVFCAHQLQSDVYAEVVLLDIDTCPAPDPNTYGRMIGFTANAHLPGDEVRRQCSLILHRPFEMRLLRREVLEEENIFSMQVLQQPHELQKVTERSGPFLDSKASTVSIDGRTFKLSPKELTVMKLLLEKRGETVSREMICGAIGESTANKADVYICFLRRKLEDVLGYKLIYTVRGQGYKILSKS